MGFIQKGIGNVWYLIPYFIVKICSLPFVVVDRAISDYHERQMAKTELEKAKIELELLKHKEKQDKQACGPL
jgi:hypothetical protein